MVGKVRGFVSHVHMARGGGSADVIIMPDVARVRLTFGMSVLNNLIAAHKQRRAVDLQLEGRSIVGVEVPGPSGLGP